MFTLQYWHSIHSIQCYSSIKLWRQCHLCEAKIFMWFSSYIHMYAFMTHTICVINKRNQDLHSHWLSRIIIIFFNFCHSALEQSKHTPEQSKHYNLIIKTEKWKTINTNLSANFQVVGCIMSSNKVYRDINAQNMWAGLNLTNILKVKEVFLVMCVQRIIHQRKHYENINAKLFPKFNRVSLDKSSHDHTKCQTIIKIMNNSKWKYNLIPHKMSI